MTEDKHLLERALKRLGRTLNNPHATAQAVMTDLEWVDKRTPDKRKRPPEAKQAIKWLKERGLWDVYTGKAPREAQQLSKTRYEQAGRRPWRKNVLLRLNDAEQATLDKRKQPGEPDATAIKRLAGLTDTPR